MKTKTKIIIFGLSAILIFGGAVFFGISKKAQAASSSKISKIEITNFNELESKGSFLVSPVYQAEFTFTGLGLQWQENESQADFKIYIRILNNQKWSEWVEVKNKVKDAPEFYKAESLFSDLIFIRGQAVQLKIGGNQEIFSLIKKIEIHYFDSDIKAESKSNSNFQIALSQDELNIIPRSNWIADELDETIRASLWDEDYKEIKKFIIHHTGTVLKDLNDDKIINQRDYEIAVQGTYDWHAKILGWGDAGYNFIIDPSGRIFEGRYGGDGVVGGHALREAGCNKIKTGQDEVLGFNKETIGIALIGNYGLDSLTPAAKQSLINLIAYKAREFGAQPAGQSYFQDTVYPNILGHLDVDCTLCPGDAIYSVLSEIRQTAQEKFEEIGGLIARIPKVQFINQSNETIILKPGEEKTVWVEFKNEGKTSWHNYTSEDIYLASHEIKNQLASLNSYRIALDQGVSVVKYQLDRPNVKPGEIGRFTFTLKAPENRSVQVENLLLAWGENGWLPNTETQFVIANTNLDFGAAPLDFLTPSTVFENKSQKYNLQFQNIGSKTWQRDDIELKIYGSFKAGAEIKFNEENAEPGQVATFDFYLTNPAFGAYTPKFLLVRKVNLGGIFDEEKVIGSDFEPEIKVESSNQAELISHNIPPALLNTWRPDITFKFKNTGLTTWQRGRTILKIYDSAGNQSKFYDRYDWLNYEVAAWLVEGQIEPGETGTFKLYLRPPREPGVYGQKFVLEDNGQKIYINKKFSYDLLTRVDRY